MARTQSSHPIGIPVDKRNVQTLKRETLTNSEVSCTRMVRLVKYWYSASSLKVFYIRLDGVWGRQAGLAGGAPALGRA